MLSKFSVTRPYTVVVAVVLVLILGAVSFMNLQTDLLPSMNLPYLVIMTTYPGASPEEVEMVVTKPVEQIVATTNNIKNVRSVSREGQSVVILEFTNDVNMDSATIAVNGSLDMIKPMWNDSVGSPMVIRVNPDMMPVMVASVDVKGMNIAEISDFVTEKIIPELESVNGVASVTGEGLLKESTEVLISPEKIESLNNRILHAVDAGLAEAQIKLQDADKQIRQGKTQLETEKTKRQAEMNQGQQALELATQQLNTAMAALADGERQLAASKQSLETTMTVLNIREQELSLQEKALLDLGGSITPSQGATLRITQESLAAVRTNQAQTAAALDEVSGRYQAILAQKTALEGQQRELAVQERQLEQGKQLLEAETQKAAVQLEAAELTLNEQLQSFETARDAAFKKASLDGVITPAMISGILAAQNFAMPAGYMSESGVEYLVKVGDKLKNLDEMKELLLFDTNAEGVGKVYLADVADVSIKDNADELYAKVNGNDAVILMLQKQSNFSTTEVAKNIRSRINQLMASHEGLSITGLMDQGVYIDIVVDSVLDNLLYGGLLAILILVLFLRSIKPTVVIAVSIPISLVFAVAMMYFSGVTINVISLAGLALGVGMLVDNSIVVIENIFRLKNEGKSAISAAVEGTNEVSGAILASTLTTACVFLPIVFTRGISRQLFSDMGLTIAYSLFASLIVAVTLVPTMATTALKNSKERRFILFERLVGIYEMLLRWALAHRAIVMSVVCILFAASIYLATTLGTSFLPDMDAPQMSVTIQMPRGASTDDTIAMSETVIDRIAAIPDIDTIGAFQNRGFGGFGQGRGAGDSSMSLYLVLKEQRTESNVAIEKRIRENTADLNCDIVISSNNMDMTALGGSGIDVVIKGRELDTLRNLAMEVAQVVEQTEGTVEVSSGFEDGIFEMRITVDKEKAMENNLTVAQVYSQVSAFLNQSRTATTLTAVSKDYPVIVADAISRQLTRAGLADLKLKQTKNGEEVFIRLDEIAEISEATGLSSIRRNAQERYLSVTATIDTDYNIGLVSREISAKLKELDIPPGYQVSLAGETQTINDSMRDLFYMLVLAIIFIYLIMVAQFQSLLSPFIVMFTIPLAFTGGLLSLAATGYDLSLVAMLGFLVLSGVVVNNGIVFVDYTNQLRDKGLSTHDALVQAGKTRLRPILMTAITTILGLSTLSFGVGTGAEMLQPLAIVAIGGLTYATLLTLLVVPVMYHILHRKRTRTTIVEGVDF